MPDWSSFARRILRRARMTRCCSSATTRTAAPIEVVGLELGGGFAGDPRNGDARGSPHNRVDLRVDDDTYAAIRRIALDSDRNVSDVVREAIRRYPHASAGRPCSSHAWA